MNILEKYYSCFDEKDSKLINDLDQYILKEIQNIGAIEYLIPAMISKANLEKCGYFNSFPQQLTKVAPYDDNSCSEETLYLTPAACLHIYPMLKNGGIDKKIITTKARVYRAENNFDGHTRLWDFTVREIVFVGEKEFVLEELDKTKRRTKTIVDKLGISAQIVDAVDPFYPTKENIVKMRIQHSNNMKYELRCLINESNISLASFNYHGTHFSKVFNFDKNSRIVTGCVGFGLERCLVAIKNYGVDWRG